MLPPGLEDLYHSMRRHLSLPLLKGASIMYQLLFQWNETLESSTSAREFWMAINCHDPAEPQHCPTEAVAVGIMPELERRLAGNTGGMLQVSPVMTESSGSRTLLNASVGSLHRMVFDWL